MGVNEQRIIELETKLSYQEDLIQELNKHVIDQPRQIDALTSLCGRLKEQLKEIMLSMSDIETGDEKPPHY